MAPMFRQAALAAMLVTASSDETCSNGACEEETSLMQDLVKRNRQTKLASSMLQVDLKSKHERKGSISQLVQTAEHLMKNGATPDVLMFVTETISEITDAVLPAIQREHEADQELLTKWYDATVAANTKFTDSASALTDPRASEPQKALQQCRSEEKRKCASARSCQVQLEELWDQYVAAEEKMREKHTNVKNHICPTDEGKSCCYDCLDDDCLNNCIKGYGTKECPKPPDWEPRWECPNWPEIRTGPNTAEYCSPSNLGKDCVGYDKTGPHCPAANNRYNISEYSKEVRKYRDALFRTTTDGQKHGIFQEYINQKDKPKEAWARYTEKLAECTTADDELEAQTQICDADQDAMEVSICAHDGDSRDARVRFGKEMAEASRLYRIAIHGKEDLSWFEDHAEVVETAEGKYWVPECPAFDGESTSYVKDQQATDLVDGRTMDIRTVNDTRQGVEGGICRLEHDRKREVATLHVVMCLLTKVNKHVETSIATGEDCITETSHPDRVKTEIDECHRLPSQINAEIKGTQSADGAREINTDSATKDWNGDNWDSDVVEISKKYNIDMSIDYHRLLIASDMIVPTDTPCTQDFIGWEQGASVEAGCSAPQICLGMDQGGATGFCEKMKPAPADEFYTPTASHCMWHQNYLKENQQDADSFKCANSMCIDIRGRCNGVDNCGDNSDEANCAIVEQHTNNCDATKAQFPGQIIVAAASGRAAQLLAPAVGDKVFFDRSGTDLDGAENPRNEYKIVGDELQRHRPAGNDNEGSVMDSLGDMAGKMWLKYSNDDKFTPADHVMLKVSVPHPTKVYVNRVARDSADGVSAPFVGPAGWEQTNLKGAEFTMEYTVRGNAKGLDKDGLEFQGHGLRKEFFQNGESTVEEKFKGTVWSKVFPAGDIMIPGNGGNEGSFLVFMEPADCWTLPLGPVAPAPAPAPVD